MTRSSVPPPVTQVLDAAESWLPRRMAAVERRLGEVVADGGALLAAEAGATLAAGGKRLRPMLVLVCAGADAGDGAVRAATAIELVHMATLVHDDVLDAAPLRRGRPTVVARAGRSAATAVGDLLFSRAFAELAGDDEGSERARRAARAGLGRPRPGRARPAPRRVRRLDLGRALPRAVPAEDRAAVRVRVPDRRGARRGLGARAADLRARDRARVPAARRRPRRHRPAVADRQGARHRPARRHGDPAADPRPRARSRARVPRPARRSTSRRPRRPASASRRPGCSTRCARTRAGGSRRRRPCWRRRRPTGGGGSS